MRAQLGPVFLYTNHLEKIVSFYRDSLGIPIKSHAPDHALWLDTGSVPLALHVPETPWYPESDLDNGGLLLWLQVEDDLEQVASRLKRESAEVLTPVIHAGRRDLLLIRDPKGRRIGLYRERTA
jgi:catechol-2,3-dioxygenase